MSRNVSVYANALKALLPLGVAWSWESGGFGDTMLSATAQELSRIDADTGAVLAAAIEYHRPSSFFFTLSAYQAVADQATQIIPRKSATIGQSIGYRLWSPTASVAVTPAPSVFLDDSIRPAAIGMSIGAVLWSANGHYYLRVQFDPSLINKAALMAALISFKQAHVFIVSVDVPNLGN